MRQPTQILPHPAAPATRATLISVMADAGLPGAVTADGTVLVDGVAALNSWFVRFRTGSSLSTASRYEVRGGQLFNAGGLDWRLTVPQVPGVGRVTVRAVTGELEPLPDLPVTRAGYPYGIRSTVVTGVAA